LYKVVNYETFPEKSRNLRHSGHPSQQPPPQRYLTQHHPQRIANHSAERPLIQLVQGYVLDHNRNGFCIGSCDAYLQRSLMTDFYGQVEAYSKATGTLAFTAFDRHGRLKPEYKEHEVKKGSGVWGAELETGHVLLFRRIQITEALRRQGHA
jgi:hypothetical protein